MKVVIDDIRYGPIVEIGEKPMRLADLLRHHRGISGMSLERAALAAGISKTYLFELESGAAVDPSFGIMIRIARMYGISLDAVAKAISGHAGNPP
jgi:transcriptional regulator with XRE-family HTH domain